MRHHNLTSSIAKVTVFILGFHEFDRIAGGSKRDARDAFLR